MGLAAFNKMRREQAEREKAQRKAEEEKPIQRDKAKQKTKNGDNE